MSENIVKELRDFNHYKAADYVEFLELQLASLRADFKPAQADALREAAEQLAQDTTLMQTTNGITWIPRDNLVGASRWLKAEADKIERSNDG